MGLYFDLSIWEKREEIGGVQVGKPPWLLGLMREWGSEYVGEGPGLLWGFSPCVIPGEAPVAGDQCPTPTPYGSTQEP